MIKQLKTLAEKLPCSIGRALSVFSLSWRLGRQYRKFHRIALSSLDWSDAGRKEYTLHQLQMVVEYARVKFSLREETIC